MVLTKFECELLAELAQIERFSDLRLADVIYAIRKETGAISKIIARLDALLPLS